MAAQDSRSTRWADVPRSKAIELEWLVDVDEWAAVHGERTELPVPAAITASLWDRIERVPFAHCGRDDARTRARNVLRWAATALSSYMAVSGGRAAESGVASRPWRLRSEDDEDSVSLIFAVPLRSESSALGPLLLRLDLTADELGKPSITIGLREDFPSRTSRHR